VTTAARFAIVWVLFASVGTMSCGDEPATTTPTSVSSPTTVNWTTHVGTNGSASRSFVASRAGSVTVMLRSADVPLGIGVGVPGASGGGCRAAVSVTAAPNDAPQLTTAVEEGTFCVLVFDVGGIVDPIPFTLQLVHP
jgi:hypothetical protein